MYSQGEETKLNSPHVLNDNHTLLKIWSESCPVLSMGSSIISLYFSELAVFFILYFFFKVKENNYFCIGCIYINVFGRKYNKEYSLWGRKIIGNFYHFVRMLHFL